MQRTDERESSVDADSDVDYEQLLDDDVRGASTDTAGSGSGATSDPVAGSETAIHSGTAGTSEGTGSGSRIGVDGRYFSVKALGIAGGLLFAGTFLGSMIPLIGGSIGRAAGLFLGAFAVGLLFSERRYAEAGIAGAGVGAVSVLTGILSVGMLPVGLHFLQDYGLGVAAVGGVVGLVLALVGTYFGRDLRAGLTGELPDSS